MALDEGEAEKLHASLITQRFTERHLTLVLWEFPGRLPDLGVPVG